MIKIIKQISTLMIICFLIVSVIPNYAFAQNANISSPNSIQGYDNEKGYDYIYFGKKDDNSIKWKVLSLSGNASEEGDTLKNDHDSLIDNSKALFILSEAALGGQYMYDADQYPSPVDHTYPNSIIKTFCSTLASEGKADNSPASFSNSELKAILKTSKSELKEDNINDQYHIRKVENELSNDKFFLPSISEITKSDYGFNEEYLEIADTNRKNGDKAEGVTSSSYYLRTTLTTDEIGNGSICCYILGTNGKGKKANDIFIGNYTVYNILLAANLNKDAILFATAADSEKSAFSKVEENTAHEWKLTLKDDQDFSDGASVDASTTVPGKEIAITHKNLSAVSEDYDHVTAAIYDKDNNLLYYGSLNDDKAATESKLTVPEDMADGTYTLKVFGEQWNGAKFTDYASGTPFETELVIDSATVAAEEVKETISALPKLDKITLADKEAVEAARKAYDALSKEQKEKIDAETLKKLTDAEAKIAELQKAADTQSSTPPTETPASTKPTQTPTAKTSVIKKGSKVTVGNINYKVTSINAKSRAVTVTGMKNKKKTSVKIPATIKINKVSYKVTAIANNAFKGNKKLKTVTIGANVKTIGKNVFVNCKNLKKIIVKTKVLKKVGAKSLKGIHKKAVIKVPAKKLKAYKKRFKKKGQAKTVRISK